MDRLRRWHRQLAIRDVFGAHAAAEADERLRVCAVRLADHTALMLRALHGLDAEADP